MRERIPPPGPRPGVEDPYRPYAPYTAPRARRGQPEAARHGFAMFHDGNAGHFWRGEIFSRLGDALLTTGIVLWIAQLTFSPRSIALVVALLALPWLLAGPLAVPLQNVAEPGRLLRGVGQARVLFTFGLLVMQLIHYRGIDSGALFPVVYLLVFAIGLCGRLREALRVAATRTCLAPGELERVANDLHVGAAVVAVVGPLLAALLFLALGERILLIAVAAAVIYFVGANSDGFLEALPAGRRAFALVTLELAVEDEELRAELREASQLAERRAGIVLGEDEWAEAEWTRAERALPEWYQFGPRSIGQGVADLRAGLGLAALASSSRTSLYVLGSLALLGGGLTVLEVFYVLYVLQAPIFYLGPLLAAEAGGLALGGMLAAGLVARGSWRRAIMLGLLGAGVALALWGAQPSLPVVLPAALLLGTANAFAVMGARRGLLIGYDGPQRRALSAAEECVTALCAIAGAGIFVFFYLYLSPTYLNFQVVARNPILTRFGLSPDYTNYTSWSLGELFLVSGLLLMFLSVLFGISLVVGSVGPRGAMAPLAAPGLGAGLTGRSMAFPATGLVADMDGWDDEGDGSRYTPRRARGNESARIDAYGYDDEDDGGW